MAAIFSLLLQFYLNRQVAHHKDFALNKEKLAAFAMAKRSKDKVEQVRMNKGNYEFLFPPMKIQEKKTDKKEEVATDSSNQAGKKKSEEKPEKKDKS